MLMLVFNDAFKATHLICDIEASIREVYKWARGMRYSYTVFVSCLLHVTDDTTDCLIAFHCHSFVAENHEPLIPAIAYLAPQTWPRSSEEDNNLIKSSASTVSAAPIYTVM